MLQARLTTVVHLYKDFLPGVTQSFHIHLFILYFVYNFCSTLIMECVSLFLYKLIQLLCQICKEKKFNSA